MRPALVGVGEATFGIFAPAVLADFYPERDRNRILSIFYLAIPVGAALGYLAGGEMGSPVGLARRRSSVCAVPGLVVAALYGVDWARAGARRQRRDRADRCATIAATSSRGSSQSGFFDSDLRPGEADLCHGRNLGVGARVSAPVNGLSVANASLVVGAMTVIDGIAGTIVGGWMAQRWLRTNHRALYLLSFWSVALTLPFGVLVFFGPRAMTIPALFAAEFFIFLNTGPLNAAIVNSVYGAGARHGHLHQPVLHSLLRRHVFAADHRRDQRPHEPEHRPGRDAGFAC